MSADRVLDAAIRIGEHLERENDLSLRTVQTVAWILGRTATSLPTVSPALKSLVERSDLRGLVRLASHLAAILASGFLLSAAWGGAWLVPALVLHGVFLVEALSVMAQVLSFKLTGKRIFKMAPIHRHFELKGWPGPRVIVRFWIVSVMLALLALASLKLR